MRDVVTITRKEAKERGLKRYFTGEPCPKGHVGERYTNSAVCVKCDKERHKEKGNSPTFRARQNRYRKRFPHKFKQWNRNSRLKRDFGITIEEWQSMLLNQSGVCGICDTAINESNWATDHCHKSGKVRGILCSACNSGLGQFKDNPTFLRRAADYVEKHK